MHSCRRLFRELGCAVAFSSSALAAVPVLPADSRGAGSPLFILWMHTLSLSAACQLLMLLLGLLCTLMYRKCIGKVYEYNSISTDLILKCYIYLVNLSF